jgi:phosphohistidine phosphatase
VDLYLVRHAIAEARDSERWPDDALRPLSVDGRELFRIAARGLLRLGIRVDAVLTSSYLRASQSAEILTEEADWPEAEVSSALEPLEPLSSVLRELEARTERRLAVVGHEPDLSDLASQLLTGDARTLALDLKKGSVTCVRFPGQAASGSGVLRWSVSPRMLRALGG